jgi:hypothetical protein
MWESPITHRHITYSSHSINAIMHFTWNMHCMKHSMACRGAIRSKPPQAVRSNVAYMWHRRRHLRPRPEPIDMYLSAHRQRHHTHAFVLGNSFSPRRLTSMTHCCSCMLRDARMRMWTHIRTHAELACISTYMYMLHYVTSTDGQSTYGAHATLASCLLTQADMARDTVQRVWTSPTTRDDAS